MAKFPPKLMTKWKYFSSPELLLSTPYVILYYLINFIGMDIKRVPFHHTHITHYKRRKACDTPSIKSLPFASSQFCPSFPSVCSLRAWLLFILFIYHFLHHPTASSRHDAVIIISNCSCVHFPADLGYVT